MIKFYCPHCATPYEADDADAGQAFPCDACKRSMTVPSPAQPSLAARVNRADPAIQQDRKPHQGIQVRIPAPGERRKVKDSAESPLVDDPTAVCSGRASFNDGEGSPKAHTTNSKTVCWRIALAIIIALACYPLLSLMVPRTEAGAFLKMLAVIGIGVGLLRWAKRNSGALKSFRAEWIWIVIFAVDGGFGIAAALYHRDTEKRSHAALANSEPNLGIVTLPSSKGTDGKPWYLDFFAEGDSSSDVKPQDFDKVIRDENEIIRKNAKDSEAHHIRGNAWMGKKEYDKAIRDYDEAIRLNPGNASYYFSRAYAWGQKNEYDKAIRDYDEAIRLDPKWFLAHLNRAWAFGEKKDYEKAIRGYEDAIGLGGKQTIAYRYLALLLATCPERKYRNRPRAIELATKACELTDWKGGLELDALASCHFEYQHLDEAIRYQTQAVQDTGLSNADREAIRQRLTFYNQRTFWAVDAPDGLDVRINSRVTDIFGKLHGTIHNETGKTLTKLKLLVKTASWERRYDVEISVLNNSTSTFEVFIGDAGLEIKTFKVLD